MYIKDGKLIFTPRDFPLDVEVQDRRKNRPTLYSMVYTGNQKLKLEKPNTKTHNSQH